MLLAGRGMLLRLAPACMRPCGVAERLFGGRHFAGGRASSMLQRLWQQ